MYENLPDRVKKQVLYFLQADDFVAAKMLYDAWLKEYKSKAPEDAIAEEVASFE